jgi:hypothetical protein
VVIKPVGKKVEIEGTSLPKQKAFVDHHYGTPTESIKPSFEDKLELCSLTSLKGTKAKLPQTREKVKGHIEAMMKAKGLELASKLPPAYQKALESTLQTLSNAGHNKKVVAGARFALTQFLTKKLSQSEC